MTFYLIPEITLGLLVLTGGYLYAVSPLNPDRAEPVAWPRIAAPSTRPLGCRLVA